ncbi:MAG: response regulator, partial [Acidobacteriota bacterium]
DTGVGMDAQTCAQIFEPFFTTKEQGKGSGLGLATSYGIVKQSGGYIWCVSELGRGTTFEILLPYSDQAPALQSRQDQPPESAGGIETILLVEDEEAVRRMCLRILEARGYRVLDCATPLGALTLAREYRERLDLLLTDVVMPGLSGPQLAEELIALRPEMKVLFMSGYSEDNASIQNSLDSRHAFLGKPFSANSLSGKVRELLDTEPQPSSGPPIAHSHKSTQD